jgi:hypothetical protein
LADSNLSAPQAIINSSIFVNNPTGGSYAPWLLIFNCLKESKSRIVAIVGLPIALPKLLLELLHSVPQSETLLVSLCA